MSLTTIDGKSAALGDFAGQALLIVNVASQCGFTPQYAGLEALHRRFRERGFAVLGFPCDQFGDQERATKSAKGGPASASVARGPRRRGCDVGLALEVHPLGVFRFYVDAVAEIDVTFQRLRPFGPRRRLGPGSAPVANATRQSDMRSESLRS